LKGTELSGLNQADVAVRLTSEQGPIIHPSRVNIEYLLCAAFCTWDAAGNEPDKIP
jgi:hypothetical protein